VIRMDRQTRKKLYSLQANLCRILADPVRLEIIDLLADGERTVGELTAELGIRQANVSQHLMTMRERGVLVARRSGLNVIYRLKHPKLTQACAIVREILAEELGENQTLFAGLEQVEAIRKHSN
ncbi:MAG: metalloregulator ArsR/SmtB family transcription factor, partial [Dehalococcoidia bacterium]|nr:metalloregulator ArsR/SmtB family transcription factor [Dehalococcoidia bacterium]